MFRPPPDGRGAADALDRPATPRPLYSYWMHLFLTRLRRVKNERKHGVYFADV